MTNLLIAIANIVENPVLDLASSTHGSNRVNNMGDALEIYMKDVFCDTLGETDGRKKHTIHSECFSYLGNKNNPPDFVIRDGDAVEVKKIENFTSALALNSSHPKDKLHRDDPKIARPCRECEWGKWVSRDIIYAIGVAPKWVNRLKALWLVYGDCYAAEREIYTRITRKISDGINEIGDIDLTDTKELAGVKRVDPLGITNLRIRGMWQIENPLKVFEDYIAVDRENDFTLYAILRQEKYDSFSEVDRTRLENLQSENFKISDIEIRSPNNPAQLLKAKLISYTK